MTSLKHFIFVLMLLSFSLRSFSCENKVSKKKVMLFFDINLSLKEVDAAKLAACKRGETFILYPDNQVASDFRKVSYAHATKDEYYELNCKNKTDPKKVAACKKLNQEIGKLKTKMTSFDLKDFEINSEKISNVLTSVKDTGGSITTLIISGHDGGGEVNSDYIEGTFTKNDFFKSYNSIFTKKQNKDLQTILLWGCYTGTYAETIDWKNQFSKARSILGFYDSGPLAIRPASAGLMTDFLEKEEALVSSKDTDDLKKMVQGLNSILSVQPGMMIDPECSKENVYYAHYLKNKAKKTVYITDGDEKKICDFVMDEWNDTHYKLLISYMEGDFELPAQIAGSDLRMVYSFVRQNQNCFQEDNFVDANRIGLLLFWNGVRDNFFSKYHDLIDVASKELESIKEELRRREIELNQLRNEMSEYQARDASTKKNGDSKTDDYNKKISDLRLSLEEYKRSYKNLLSAELPTSKTGRKDLLRFLRLINNDINSPDYKKNEVKHPNIGKAFKQMDQILYQLDTSCVNFLEWHEFKKNKRRPANRCEDKK